MINNISYIFIPFRYKEKTDTKSILTALELDRQWRRVDDKIKYMLKYVADKIENKESGKSRCAHFVLTDEAMELYGFAGEKNTFYTEKHLLNGIEAAYAFEITGVQIYYFSTSVSLLIFQLHFKSTSGVSGSLPVYFYKMDGAWGSGVPRWLCPFPPVGSSPCSPCAAAPWR